MTILVLGDSCAFGLELPDLPTTTAGLLSNEYWDPDKLESATLTPSRLSWPQLVADALGQDLDNFSVIGGNNHKIHRSAVTQSLIKQYDLVICAWTEVTRFEISWRGRECPVSVNNPKWTWVKEYYANHFDYELEFERFQTNILTLQSFFQQRNQPYLFVRAFGDHWHRIGRSGLTRATLQHTARHREYEALQSCFDLTRCVFWDEPMVDYCKKMRVEFGPGGHFLAQGHRLVADKILEFLKSPGHD